MSNMYFFYHLSILSSFQVLHLKMFMPFTIHLDPYLRKVIKEERSSFLAMQSGAPVPNAATTDIKLNGNVIHEQPNPPVAMHVPWNGQPWATVTLPTPDQSKPTIYPKYPSMVPTISHCNYGIMPTNPYVPTSNQLCFKPTLPSRLQDRVLSSLTAEEVSELLKHLDGFRTAQVTTDEILSFLVDLLIWNLCQYFRLSNILELLLIAILADAFCLTATWTS